ncbi:GGDEF domain-containing protein [Zobellella endophytica]|uniref:GGDEF domain-containing protein n=1 Tax=Zobellella endophytica TaxID=2116700 RepID=A0A2P7R7F9_9GAMM|nr:EAL domain-containing protein [Zobellella endophytica]PSJ46154.1 GGDEF domain-containing protein [Zobellella endophytica]
MLLSVIEQAFLLLALGWLLTVNIRRGQDYPRLLVMTSGLWFGLAAITCMLLPFSVSPGVLLDARNAVLFVAGLFGGPVAGTMAALLAGGFRWWLGGEGASLGMLNMALALAMGLGVRHAVAHGRARLDTVALLPVVLVLHLTTLGLLMPLMDADERVLLLSVSWPFLLGMVPLTLMLILILQDAEQRHREQKALRASESRLKAITGALPDLMFVMDEEGRYLEVMASNPALLPDTGEKLVGLGLPDVFASGQAEQLLAFIRQTLRRQGVNTLVYELETCGGRRTVESTAQALEGHFGGRQAVVVLTRDISARVKHETELRIAAVAFESFQGMLVTDAESRILRVNRAFTDITGYASEEVVGQTPRLFSSGRHSPEFYRQMWQTIRDKGHWQGEIYNKRKSGHIYPQWLSISAVRDGRERISHYVAAISDISQRKEDEAKINHLAFYDALTGLPNRRLLAERLKQAQAVSARSARQGALIFIDLDNFKDINDLWGHQVGDQLLQQAAQRLNQVVRETDTVARLGGDEFAVLLGELSEQPAQSAARLEHIGHKLLEVLERPYVHEIHSLRGSASLGLVMFDDHGQTADDLLQQAELAMYEAKSAGKGKLRFFDPVMQEVITRRLQLEEDILRGLSEREFCLYFQPQVDVRGRMVGAEALVRWRHPRRGVLAPGAFIDVAEAAGLMTRIDRIMLRRACEQLAHWARLPAFDDFSLSVNISAAQLYQPGFVDDVLALLSETGADPGRLKLELTESMLLDDMPKAIERMRALKKYGIRFAIDDFGTGYSSLHYLQQLPLDQLKVDQSFVRVLPADQNSLNIIRAIIAMAGSLQLEVIAEGVETPAQRALLQDNGCLLYQGYLFSHPEPAVVIERIRLAPLPAFGR